MARFGRSFPMPRRGVRPLRRSLFLLDLTDTITMSENILKSISKALTDTVTMSESFLKSISKTLTDTLTMSEVFTTLRTAIQSFTETVTISENFIKTISKNLTDTITMSEIFTKAGTFLRTFTDEISLTESFTILFNSIAGGILKRLTNVPRSVARAIQGITFGGTDKPTGGVTGGDKPEQT